MQSRLNCIEYFMHKGNSGCLTGWITFINLLMNRHQVLRKDKYNFIYILYIYLSMCVCIYYIYTLKIQKGIEKDPSQVGVTIPCDTGIWGSAPLVPPPLNQLACSLRVDIFSILPLMRLSLFLMETLTSRRKWGLALWVLRLRHRALRNRCGGGNKKERGE